jgi:hypothetical protein
MMAFFESRMDVVEMKESDKYAQGTVDDTKAKELQLDLLCRKKPAGKMPNITIHITKILPPLRKRVRKVWGVEITVENVSVPIYFGSTDAAMVYICTLLKQKMGSIFSRDFFKHALVAPHLNTPRHKDVQWLEKVYRTLYPGANKDFHDWYKGMKKGSCHGVSQGKAAAVRIVGKNIIRLNAKACYYCAIQTQELTNDESYYYLAIPSENITLSKELMTIVDME